MKRLLGVLLFFFLLQTGFCQSPHLDSLKHNLSLAPNDSSRLVVLAHLAKDYCEFRPDSASLYGAIAINLAQKLGNMELEAEAFFWLARANSTLGNIPKAVEMDLSTLRVAQAVDSKRFQANAMQTLSESYAEALDFDRSMKLSRRAAQVYESDKRPHQACSAMSSIGYFYLQMGQIDSAEFYCQQAFAKWKKLQRTNNERIVSIIRTHLAAIEVKKGNIDGAIQYLKQNKNSSSEEQLVKTNYQLAQIYFQRNQIDSAIFFAQQSLQLAEQIHRYPSIIESAQLLSKLTTSRDLKLSLSYEEKALQVYDFINAMQKKAALGNLIDFDEQQRQFEIDSATKAYQNRLRQYALLAGVGVLILIAAIQYYNNRQKRIVNTALSETLSNLKSTQSQLIQAEKMASLGELTAGIAHEIQNPLNFVNNFSEVNTELIVEMNNEIAKGNLAEAKAIATSVTENLEKINHHGKRADAIVKGMLQHSRNSTGQKEPTDINGLCDEYLRLAYHGLRAQDKSFNAKFETAFDPNLSKINVVPQDLGRVILNLINNAFYAVTEKKKSSDAGFEPKVFVQTKTSENKIEIIVKDNGTGIPPKAIDKIFQPFFTTKPAGQGTGLGLSLSYDVISKGHQGEIKVETSPNDGTSFIIILPNPKT